MKLYKPLVVRRKCLWFFATYAIVFTFQPAVHARQEVQICGTHDRKSLEEVMLHRLSQQSGSKRLRSLTAQAVIPDRGNIAVISDSDGVVARRNLFNLDGKTLRFLPANGGSISY